MTTMNKNIDFSQSIIKDIVSLNYKSAHIFEKYGIDFCCNGDRPLVEAVEEKNLNMNELIGEIKDIFNTSNDQDLQFMKMELNDLVNHILETHHKFVREMVPIITTHLEKVSSVHGHNYEFLIEVRDVFKELSEELNSHMFKEEQILFPIINSLVESEQNDTEAAQHSCGSISNPINQMEAEHSSAGSALEKMRSLTTNYMTPPDACETFKLTYKELEDFEKDLHKHVHLENNILFPRAIELERKLAAK